MLALGGFQAWRLLAPAGLGQWVFPCPQKQTKEAPPSVSQSPEVADSSLDRCVDGLSYLGLGRVKRGHGSHLWAWLREVGARWDCGHGRLATADAWVRVRLTGQCHTPCVVSSGWVPILSSPAPPRPAPPTICSGWASVRSVE